MKNLYTLLAIFISFSAYAQTLAFTDGDSLYLNETATNVNDDFTLKGHVKNNSTMQVSVNWRIDTVYNPNGWELSLCDKDFCLDVAVNVVNTFSLDADSISILKGGFVPNGNAGSAYFKAKVQAIGSGDPALYIIYKADVDMDISDGITTFETTTISIYPNPTTSFVNINVSGNEEIEKIIVYNVIGKVVENISTINDLTTINVKNYNKGLYIIKLFGKNDNLFHTQSFVKK